LLNSRVSRQHRFSAIIAARIVIFTLQTDKSNFLFNWATNALESVAFHSSSTSLGYFSTAKIQKSKKDSISAEFLLAESKKINLACN
jgi:hypothetical protein